MKGAKAKVYMEFLNYKGDVTDRDVIAEFCHENWAKSFIKHEEESREYLCDNFTRLVMEVVE